MLPCKYKAVLLEKLQGDQRLTTIKFWGALSTCYKLYVKSKFFLSPKEEKKSLSPVAPARC